MDTGLTIPPWSGRAAQAALERVRAEGARAKAPCAICHLSIDYALRYPHPQSCSVQHIKSRRDFPALTWEPSNWAPAHLDCNQSAGASPQLGLGVSDW